MLMISDGGAGIAQVAYYTLGGPDDSMTQWFSDPSVQTLDFGAIDPAGDRLAFIADYGSAVTGSTCRTSRR
ncbi:MAG: hypothetical protein ACYDHH_16150 [Solirubrobacteraceae bacterium]